MQTYIAIVSGSISKERRSSVTSSYHGKRWKKSTSCRFGPECNIHMKVIHVMFFGFFFSAIFAGPRFVEIKKFCYHGNMTLRLFFSISSIVHLNGIRLLIWRFLSKTVWREVGRHVTMVAKFLDLNKLCWQRRQLALSNGKRNVCATVLFLGAIMHRKVIRVRRDFPWILCLPRISYLAFKYSLWSCVSRNLHWICIELF